MIRLVLAVTAILHFSTAALAQDETNPVSRFEGSVDATWQSPRLVSVGTESSIRAGHVITVTATGQVDINWQRRSKRKCGFLGIGCKRVSWIEHNWLTPDQAPIRLIIRPKGSSTIAAEQIIGSSPKSIYVPANAENFDREYQLFAVLEGAGNGINPAQSAGAFTLQVSVDAKPRSQALSNWLSIKKPNPEEVISSLDLVLTDAFSWDVASDLREYASSEFILPANSSDHERIIRKAIELAPGDPKNSLALAKYFDAIGLATEARAAFETAIEGLENSDQPEDQRTLGGAYHDLADTIMRDNGGLKRKKIQEAAAYYSLAIEAYSKANDRDAMLRSLTAHALTLRGTRTKTGLESAAASFAQAIEIAPKSLPGDTVLEGSGDTLDFLSIKSRVEVYSIGDARKKERTLEDALGGAIDPWGQRLTFARLSSTYSQALDGSDERLILDIASARDGDRNFRLFNGGGVSLIDTDSGLYIHNAHGVHSIDGDAAGVGCINPPAGGAFGFGGITPSAKSISPDGAYVVIDCFGFGPEGGSRAFFRVGEAAPEFVPEMKVRFASYPGPQLRYGPEKCGALWRKSDPSNPDSDVEFHILDYSSNQSRHIEGASGAFRLFIGDHVAFTAENGDVSIFSCSTGSLKGEIADLDAPVFQLSPNHFGLLSGDGATLQIFDENGSQIRTLGASDYFSGGNWSDFEKRMFWDHGAERLWVAQEFWSLDVIDASGTTRSSIVTNGSPTHRMTLLPGTPQIYSAPRTFRGNSKIFDLQSGNTEDLKSSNASITMLPGDGAYLRVTNNRGSVAVSLIDRHGVSTQIEPPEVSIEKKLDAIEAWKEDATSELQASLLEAFDTESSDDLANHIYLRLTPMLQARPLFGRVGLSNARYCASLHLDLADTAIRPVQIGSSRFGFKFEHSTRSWAPVEEQENGQCGYLEVPGPHPAKLAGRSSPGLGFRLTMADGTVAETAPNQSFVHKSIMAGWMYAPSKGFLLLAAPPSGVAFGPNLTAGFDLVHVDGTSMTIACSKCGDLPLDISTKLFREEVGTITHSATSDASSIVRVASDGSKFAILDEDSLIVYSLTSGAFSETARMRFSLPVHVGANRVVVSSGGNLLEYELN